DVQRPCPLMAVREIVPVGNDVVDRAARLTERGAAVHAARALLRGFVVLQRDKDLAIMEHAQRYRLRYFLNPLQLEKPRHLPHQAASRSFLAAIPAATARLTNISDSARLYSCGNTLTNFFRADSQLSSNSSASVDPV